MTVWEAFLNGVPIFFVGLGRVLVVIAGIIAFFFLMLVPPDDIDNPILRWLTWAGKIGLWCGLLFMVIVSVGLE